MRNRMCKCNLLENVILFVGILLIIFLLGINIIFNTHITLDLKEIPIISRKITQAVFLIVLGTIIIGYSTKKVRKVNDRTLFSSCALIYTILFLYMVFNVTPEIRADANAVYEGAICMIKGDYSALEKGGYFFLYPHQLGLAAYNSLIDLISQNITVHFFINYCIVMLIYVLIWKSTKLLFSGKEVVIKLTIIIMFMFYPALFFVLFLYGHFPGCLFVAGSLYLFLRKEKGIGKYNDIGVIVLLICSCTIRNNYAIAAITIAIMYVLQSIRKNNWRMALMAFLIMITFSAGSSLVKGYYQEQSGIQINEGIPKILWIAMGIQDEDTGYCMGGWWNSFTIEAYAVEAEYDEEVACEIGKRVIKERINIFKSDLIYAKDFFGLKVVSTWTDGTYQSIWSGPLEDCDQIVNTKLLKSIYNGGTVYNIMRVFGRMLTILIYIGAMAFIIGERVINGKLLYVTSFFPIIYLCGGFLFHLIWETKSQYIWTYVFFLIPLAASGWDVIIEQIKCSRVLIHKRGFK